MSEITVSLRFNRQTGKKDIVIGYESDADALPFEHEQAHKAVVERLLGAGVLEPADVGHVKTERLGVGNGCTSTKPEPTKPIIVQG